MHSFQNVRFNSYILAVQVVVTNIFQYYAFEDGIFKQFVAANFAQSLIGVGGFILFVYLNQTTNQDFIKQSFEVIGWEKQFKHIFDNLEEPVVIFTEDKAMYTNDMFIKQFNAEIKKSRVVSVQPHAEQISCWQRFLTRLKACCTCSKVKKSDPIISSTFFQKTLFTQYKDGSLEEDD